MFPLCEPIESSFGIGIWKSVFSLAETLLRVLDCAWAGLCPPIYLTRKDESDLERLKEIIPLLLLEAPLDIHGLDHSTRKAVEELHYKLQNLTTSFIARDVLLSLEADRCLQTKYSEFYLDCIDDEVFLFAWTPDLIDKIRICCRHLLRFARQINAYVCQVACPRHSKFRAARSSIRKHISGLINRVAAHENPPKVGDLGGSSFPHSSDSSDYFSLSQSPDSSHYISFPHSSDSSHYFSLSQSPDSSHYFSLSQSPDSFQSSSWSRTRKKACCGLLTKWVPILLNVAVEFCQASLTQVKELGKIRRQIYLMFSIILSCFCLIMSLAEASHKWVFPKREDGSPLYFRGAQTQLLETFLLGFGIVCSFLQLVLSVAAIVTKKDVIKFDIVPLLLSVFYMFAAIIYSRQKSVSGAKCRIHGYQVVQFRLVHGRDWVPECPQCLDNAV